MTFSQAILKHSPPASTAAYITFSFVLLVSQIVGDKQQTSSAILTACVLSKSILKRAGCANNLFMMIFVGMSEMVIIRENGQQFLRLKPANSKYEQLQTELDISQQCSAPLIISRRGPRSCEGVVTQHYITSTM